MNFEFVQKLNKAITQHQKSTNSSFIVTVILNHTHMYVETEGLKMTGVK